MIATEAEEEAAAVAAMEEVEAVVVHVQGAGIPRGRNDRMEPATWMAWMTVVA